MGSGPSLQLTCTKPWSDAPCLRAKTGEDNESCAHAGHFPYHSNKSRLQCWTVLSVAQIITGIFIFPSIVCVTVARRLSNSFTSILRNVEIVCLFAKAFKNHRKSKPDRIDVSGRTKGMYFMSTVRRTTFFREMVKERSLVNESARSKALCWLEYRHMSNVQAQLRGAGRASHFCKKLANVLSYP